jgi:hypothetical protein
MIGFSILIRVAQTIRLILRIAKALISRPDLQTIDSPHMALSLSSFWRGQKRRDCVGSKASRSFRLRRMRFAILLPPVDPILFDRHAFTWH